MKQFNPAKQTNLLQFYLQNEISIFIYQENALTGIANGLFEEFFRKINAEINLFAKGSTERSAFKHSEKKTFGVT